MKRVILMAIAVIAAVVVSAQRKQEVVNLVLTDSTFEMVMVEILPTDIVTPIVAEDGWTEAYVIKGEDGFEVRASTSGMQQGVDPDAVLFDDDSIDALKTNQNGTFKFSSNATEWDHTTGAKK